MEWLKNVLTEEIGLTIFAGGEFSSCFSCHGMVRDTCVLRGLPERGRSRGAGIE